MVKRVVAAYLWVMACWSLGAVLERSLGVTEYLGLVVGIVVAILIVSMPARLWRRSVVGRSTVRPSAPPTTGLTATD